MSLTKPELQKILRKFKLNVDGKRMDLIARIKDHLSTIEEDEVVAEDVPDTARLERLVEQMNEMRVQQEQQTKILEEIRKEFIVNSPPPTDDDETSGQSSSPPPTAGNLINNNNNAPPPMPPEKTALMQISALPPEI